MSIVVGEALGPDGLDRSVHHIAPFLYKNDGLIAPTQPDWLQWAFDILKGLF